MEKYNLSTFSELSPKQQRSEMDMNVEEFYYAGLFLLENSFVPIDLSEAEGSIKNPLGQRLEEAVAHNAELDEILNQWKSLYTTIQQKTENLENIEFLLSFMDDIYQKISAFYIDMLELKAGMPKINLLADAYRIQKETQFLDDEVLLQTMNPENLKQFVIVEEEIKAGLETVYDLVHFGVQKQKDFVFEFNLQKNNIEELVVFAKKLMQSEEISEK